MRPFFLLMALLAHGLFCQNAHAQLTLVLKKVPTNTPAGATIYVAGSFNNWQPGVAAYALAPGPAGSYSITLPTSVRGSIQFKFTRGAWASTEVLANGAQAPNRTYTIPASGTAMYADSVPAWEDLLSTRSTATASVSILNTQFFMPQLGQNRRIWLYLPPDYATSAKRYPVLYMHDAQNLFDAYTSFSGEWTVDETLDNLHKQGDYGCIVVGIDNGGAQRIDEYSPYKNTRYGGGKGDAYVRFLAQTLKPYIDQNYRTQPDAPHTGLMGSSMGGLITLYGGLAYSQVFGRIGVLSPSLWFSDSIYTLARGSSPAQPDTRMYFASGRQESGTQVREQARMVQTLQQAWAIPTQLDSLTRNGTHSESLWRITFPLAYKWLFASNITQNTARPLRPHVVAYPTPGGAAATLCVRAAGVAAAQVFVHDAVGHLVAKASLENEQVLLPTAGWPQGIYVVRVQLADGETTMRWIK